MSEDSDLWVKTFTATSPEEVIEWVDVFTDITKLPPSACLSVYAELTLMEDVNMLLVAASSRHSKIMLAERVEEMGDVCPELGQSEALIDELTYFTDEFIAEIDEEHHTARLEHFRNVLTHHNFSKLFIRLFLQSLSPTSEIIPQKFDIRHEDIFDSEFNSDPYISDDEDEDEESGFGGGDDFIERVRLSKPVSPEGWLALFRHIGVTVTTNETFRDQFQDPFFYAVDTQHTVPVYLCGPLKTPYDDEDPAANQLKDTFETAIKGKHDVAFLFYSAPISRRESETDGKQVTYWGEVYVDGEWRTMVLTQNSTSIATIVSQAKLTSNSDNDLRNPKLVESSSELIHVWSSNHVDPILDMMSSMFKQN
jgi:hypothetical protein